MHVSRNAFLLVLLALCAAAPAAVAGLRSDLASEILRRVPQWPGTEVEIPISLYEQYVRELVEGPAPPQPPVVAWIERAAYGLRIGEKEAELTAAFNVVRLPGKGGTSVRLLPADLAWRDVTVDGRKTELRRAEDGWFHFDVPEPGRYRVVATTTVKPKTAGDVRRIEFGTPPAGWTSGAVDSDAAWDVRFSRAPLSVKGTDAGTHGTVGLGAGDRLEVRWQPPRPPVHRAAQIATEAHVGWTLADGVHQVRAILNLRLWGGETSELTVNLPPGADRVRISGPDVREVQTAGARARVFLRGAIRQRSRLSIEFESPRPATGRMALPAFGVEGSSHRGGTLAVAGGAGAVLLEMDSPGLAAMALHDLPARTRGLLAAPPVYAYRLTGPWEARVDLVSMSEFPVRETLIDSALYTVLYRPDGRVMVKVIYEVRNRAQQYMAVALPPGAELVVARVSEVQKNLARGPGRTVYVPLEKSVLTTAGLVSFPVELVYVMRAEPLARTGAFRLPLPRADLPVAYARCALMLPDGMKVGQWHGVLRRADAWSSETAELEFEYGRGHLAKAPDKVPEESEPKRSGPEKPEDAERDEKRAKVRWLTATDEDLRLERGQQTLRGKNLFRAGVDYYRGKNYAKAAELFKGVIDAAPKSLEANKARQYLSNVAIALGKERKGEKEQRDLRATAKAVQKGQQWGNIDIRERQQRLLAEADLAVRRGDEDKAEAAYQVAVNLAGQLESRGEEAREQKAVVRKAEKYLAARGRLREEEGKKVTALQQQVAALQRDIGQAGGQEMEQVVEALLLPDEERSLGVTIQTPRITLYNGQRSYSSETGVPAKELPLGIRNKIVKSENHWIQRLQTGHSALRGPVPDPASAQPAPQVELGEALAEQQVTLEASAVSGLRRGGVVGGGFAYGGVASRDEIEHLKKQVEQLKTIHGQLADRKPDSAGEAPRFEVGDATDVTRPGRGKPGGALFGTTEGTWDDKRRDAVRRDFGRQVAEKAESLKAEARKATELARAGRIAEAGKLIDRLEKRAQVTAGAAEALARDGQVDYVTAAGLVSVPSRKPEPPVAGEPPARGGRADDGGFAEAGLWVTGGPKGKPSVADKPPAPRLRPARPEPVLLGEPEVTADAVALTPGFATDPDIRSGARRRSTSGRFTGLGTSVPAETGAGETRTQPGKEGGGAVTYLRYPEAKDWKDLTEFRRDFTKAVPPKPSPTGKPRSARPDDVDGEKQVQLLWKQAEELRKSMQFNESIEMLDRLIVVDPNDERAKRWREDLRYLEARKGEVRIPPSDARPDVVQHFFADELKDVQAALEDVTKAREALAHETRRQDKVKFNVGDLTVSLYNGQQLAEFVTRNYSWALAGPAAREDTSGIVVRDGGVVNVGAIRRGTGHQLTIAGGTVFSDTDVNGDQVSLQAEDDGTLVLANRPDAVANVQNVLERLRLNVGQRVGVASRNFFVDAGTAEAAGIRWKTGANGVRYAVVNEGQLRGVMDVEQRNTGADISGELPPRDAYQEAVVGTDALLANGLPVAISRAADERNTLTYNGNTLQVAHDDYLVVDNGGYLTAVKSGRMQHWSVEVEPVRFPGVPAAVVVPTVGYTVKFEKTLLDASDTLELVADYTWEGDER